MSPPPVPGDASFPRPPAARADGEASRERLVLAGLRLFAERGYAATSVRDLAQAAGVNVSAIRYYFGDKAGLYRAVFFEPMGDPEADMARYRDPALGLREALDGFYAMFLEPLCDTEAVRLCIKLRMREMVEPTGLWEEEVAVAIKPMHDLLCRVIARHLDCPPQDEPVQRLAICIAALGIHLHIGHDVMRAIAPDLPHGPAGVSAWADFLATQAEAMVERERARRTAAATPPAASAPPFSAPSPP
jgi:AcrR family transcriptional regulator